MTIDEAIKHAEEVAEENNKRAERIRDKMTSEIALSNATECETCADEHRQLAEWLKELKQLREQTKWTPVSDRLPSDSDNYLITVADFRLGHIGEHTVTITDFYAKGKKWNSVVDVLAWKPLPEPWKDGEEE